MMTLRASACSLAARSCFERVFKTMFGRRSVSSVVVVLVAALAGCPGSPTGVDLSIGYDDALRLDQLEIEATDGETTLLAPTRRPDSPGELAAGGETIAIRFADDLAGTTIIVTVRGLQDDDVVVAATGSVTLQRGELVALEVVLGDACAGDACDDAGVVADAGFADDAGSIIDAGGGDAGFVADAGFEDAGFADGGNAMTFPYTPANIGSVVPGRDTQALLDCGGVVTLVTTGTGSVTGWCSGAPQPTFHAVSTTNGNISAIAFALGSLDMRPGTTLRVQGDKPAILVVFGDAVVTDIDLSADAGVSGPGGNLVAACTQPATPGLAGGTGNAGGGGGGGGFGDVGGGGGDFSAPPDAGMPPIPGGNAGAASSDVDLQPLRGGCAGALGGQTANGALGGGAGGALQISAAGTLRVVGTIIAAGGGGRGGVPSGGGGGGGSGGAILLEGDVVNLEAAGALIANGGGGGEGGGGMPPDDDTGDNGDPGTVGNAAAAGGDGLTTTGGAGGAGGWRTVPAGVVGGDSTPIGGGGGGGGSVGRIQVNAKTTCTLLGGASPAPVSGGTAVCPP